MQTDLIHSTPDAGPADEPQPSPALYRFGFLLLPADRPAARGSRTADLLSGWVRHDLGDFRLWAHPDARVVTHARGATRLALVGDAYSTAGVPVEDLLQAASVGTDADLAMLADRLGGRFAMIVADGGRFRAFNDAFGARSLFYSTREPGALASHAHLLAGAIGATASPTVEVVLDDLAYRNRKVKYLPGDFTVFDGVFALVPNNLYDSAAGAAKRYWPVAGRRRSTFDDLLTEMQIYFDRFIPFVTGRYLPLFGITGGVDSRTILAAFRARGAAMAGVTWRGGYLAPGEEADVRRLVELLGLEHKNFDPTQGQAGPIATDSLINSGGYRRPSRLTQAMARAYPAARNTVFIRGYGGEIIRGFYNTSRRPMEDYSAASMQMAYESGGRMPELSGRIRDMFEEFRARGSYTAVERSGFDPNDIFYWEHRMGMWGSCMLNEMDAAMPSLVGFNDRSVYTAAFGLANEERLTKALLARVGAHFDPEIAALGTPGPAGAASRPRTPPVEPAPRPAPAPAPRPSAPEGGASGGHFESGAYLRQRTDLIYYQYFRFMVHCLGVDARSMVDVGSGNMPYLEWFDWIPERVSIDIRVPYQSETIRGIQGDIFQLKFEKRFDLCTCLQVLEHIPDPPPFARRLLELGQVLLVSVPYMWPKGANKWHHQDPVDLKKLSGWFGRPPNYHLVVQEPFTGRMGARLFAVFDPDDPDRRFGGDIRKNRRPLGEFGSGSL
jgi:hypothetical protein